MIRAGSVLVILITVGACDGGIDGSAHQSDGAVPPMEAGTPLEDAIAGDIGPPDSDRSDVGPPGDAGPVPDDGAGGTDGGLTPTYTLEVMVGTDSAVGTKYGADLAGHLAALMLYVNETYRRLEPAASINVVLVRHEPDVDIRGLELTTDRDTLLARWLQWAAANNPADQADPAHFDAPVLLTGTDFGMYGWSTVGPAICNNAGASLVHELGDVSAKVTAHELGHLFGLGHDTDGNRNWLMNFSPGTAWSPGSLAAIGTLVSASAGCLADCVAPPAYATIPVFTVEEQCQTRFGLPACLILNAPTQCAQLLCSNGASTCEYDDAPVLDGTSCGDGRWCIGGQCVATPQGDLAGFAGCG